MRHLAIAAALGAAFLLAACAGPGAFEGVRESADEMRGRAPVGKAAADALWPLADPAHRDERACWIAAAFVEVQAAEVWFADAGRRVVVLGALTSLQDAVDRIYDTGDPLWREADMAQLVLVFASVLERIGRAEIAGYLERGLSPANVFVAARAAMVNTIVGPAVVADLDAAMRALGDGSVSEAEARASCHRRLRRNRRLLSGFAPA